MRTYKMSVESALRVVAERHWYTEIKDKQNDAVLSFASGKDIFVSLPTGYNVNFRVHLLLTHTRSSNYCMT